VTRPNLFANAKSELTQDAVLCWLLSWADSSNAELDPDLHLTGRDLLAALLGAHGHEAPGPETSVRAERQVKRIDVVAWIGDEYILGIEDKTTTGPHSNQLERYRVALETMSKGRTVVPVYVKTGERNEDEHVRSRGWEVFGRAQLLDVLRRAADRGVKNDIVSEFHAWLDSKEQEATAWRRLPTTDPWPWASWQGFYGALEGLMPGTQHLGWDYVANPAGGFLAMWWGFFPIGTDERLYLQLQQSTLAIRVKVPSKDLRRELSREWSRRILEAGPGAGWPLRRPKRLGSGKYMAIAYWDDWRATDENGVADPEATASRLQRLSAWLAEQSSMATR